VLHFEPRPGGALSREDLGSPLPDDDLCLRAARALQAATGCTQGAHISIDKQIPSQAGLGGGSSDAATTLLALNRLWNCGLSRRELRALALPLGADVPFFVLGRNAWVQGVGEALEPLSAEIVRPGQTFVIVKPGAGLDTRVIFSHPALKRDSEAATIAGFAGEHAGGPFQFGRNDLQPVSELLCPEITQAIDWLARQGLRGRMTGSGSAVFALAPHMIDRAGAPAQWRVKVCKNLGLHPLAGWARDE